MTLYTPLALRKFYRKRYKKKTLEVCSSIISN